MTDDPRFKTWLVGLLAGLVGAGGAAAGSGLYVGSRIGDLEGRLAGALERIEVLDRARESAIEQLAARGPFGDAPDPGSTGGDALRLLTELQADLGDGLDGPGPDDLPRRMRGRGRMGRLAGELYDDYQLVRSASADPEERLAAARRMLAAPMPQLRLEGARALLDLDAEAGVEAVFEMLEQAGDDRRSQRMAAASIALLADVDSSLVDARLESLFEGDNPVYSRVAARVLEQRGSPDAVISVIASTQPALDSIDGGVRARAVADLGRLGSPSAIPTLTPLLADANSEVRLRAVESLARTRVEEVAPLLTPLLDDPIAEVRETAARALSALRQPATERRGFGGFGGPPPF